MNMRRWNNRFKIHTKAPHTRTQHTYTYMLGARVVAHAEKQHTIYTIVHQLRARKKITITFTTILWGPYEAERAISYFAMPHAGYIYRNKKKNCYVRKERHTRTEWQWLECAHSHQCSVNTNNNKKRIEWLKSKCSLVYYFDCSLFMCAVRAVPVQVARIIYNYREPYQTVTQWVCACILAGL